MDPCRIVVTSKNGPALAGATAAGPVNLGELGEAVTATLLGVLTAKEYLSLGTRVAACLPRTVRVPRDPGGKELTLYHLATHTAGLPEGRPTYESPEALYAALAEAEVIGEAGTRWAHSRLGYAVLERVVEHAVRRPFSEVVRTFVLAPLGCSEAAHVAPNGELIATAADVALFLDLHVRGFKWRCLGFNNLEELRRLHEPAVRWERAGAALGWRISRCERLGDCLWQGGAGWVGFAPRAGVGAAVLAQEGPPTSVAEIGTSLLQAAAD